MNAEGRARHQAGEAEIAGSRRDGIAVERNERPDVPAAKRVSERRDRPGLRRWIIWCEGVDRAAKSIVDPQAQRLRGQRQRRADKDEAALGARFQILGGGGHEFKPAPAESCGRAIEAPSSAASAAIIASIASGCAVMRRSAKAPVRVRALSAE